MSHWIAAARSAPRERRLVGGTSGWSSGAEALLDAVDELARLLEAHRPAEQIALDLVAAEIAHPGEIVGGLHPFGGDGHPEALGELDDRLDDGDRLLVVGGFAHEAAVDLQFVEDRLVEIAE